MSTIAGRLGTPEDDQEPNAVAGVGLDAPGARWLRRHLAGSVIAITTVVGGLYRASTVTACTVVSLEPLQFLVSIERESQMEGWLAASRIFGLNILAWNQQLLADRFAGFAPLAPATFQGIDHFVRVTGVPLLSGSIGWADCRVVADLETGDHRCFVGEAVEVGRGEGNEDDPLLHYLSRYRRLH